MRLASLITVVGSVVAGAAGPSAAEVIPPMMIPRPSYQITDDAPARVARAQPSAAEQPGREEEEAAPEAGAAQPSPTDLAQLDLEALQAYRRVSLASTPNMFGDSFTSLDAFRMPSGYGYPPYDQIGEESFVDIPAVGGAGRIKIGENNKAVPVDRVFFLYNHFHNAMALQNGFLTPSRGEQFSVDRYVLGIEKTFCCGNSSIELLVPFSGQDGFADRFLNSPSVNGSHFGNLALIFKQLLWQTEIHAVAAGFGVDIPTGGDVDIDVFDTRVTFKNEAVHLTPYLGITAAPTDRWFLNAFAQLDFATNSNSVQYRVRNQSLRGSLGEYTDQNLLYLDASWGYWLYTNPCAHCFTGLAGLVELHYATTFQDTDIVEGFTGNTAVRLANPYNRMDVLNLTAGLHAQLGPCTSVRVAAVAPLRSNADIYGPTDRLFNAEVYVALNRRF